MARYIRNAGGIINSVNDEEFATHMNVARQTALQRATPGSAAAALGAVASEDVEMPREATPDEIAAWWKAQGLVYLPDTDEAITPAEAAARTAEQAPKSGKQSAAADK